MASRTMPSPVHPATLMGKSKSIAGFWLVNCLGKKEMMQDVFVELFGLIISGKLKPIVGATYPLSRAVEAHQAMLARKTVGKIVLDPAH